MNELNFLTNGVTKSEVLNYQARLNSIEKNIRAGIIDFEKGNIEINKIRSSIIELINDLEEERNPEIAVKTKNQNIPLIQKKKIILIILIFITFILLILLNQQETIGINGNNNDNNEIQITE